MWFLLVISLMLAQAMVEAASVNITSRKSNESGTWNFNHTETSTETDYCPNEKLFNILTLDKKDKKDNLNITEIILNEVNPINIRTNLRFLSQSPHLAGTKRDEELIQYIESTWKKQGLDVVRKVTYKTLLSYPDSEHPNKVYLLDAEGNITFTSRHIEEILRPEDEHPDLVHMFNAYAANGTAQGELVYVNYARDEDFQTLLQLGINVTGMIVIAKYGNIYRGNKVYLAQKYGAAGIILFNDPSEDAQDGQDAEHVYPNSWWLQGTGAQRGSIWPRTGDPVTPGYPSIDDAHRIPFGEVGFAKIPCQPIGYHDAQELLKLLDGPIAPENWQGPLPTTLHLGPKFVNNTSNVKIRLVVNNYLKTVNTTNVIGIIKGSTEPDRYVMAGNHRDAWGFGAVDASSGTAQMLEVTRLFGMLLKKGWRPKRTIMFFSWGGEEHGLIGSTEFVEDNLIKLSDRGVAYINTDICTSGDVFTIYAAPMLKDLIINITKQVPAPKNSSETLYNSWKRYNAEKESLYATKTETPKDDFPKISLLRGGTDHVPFAFVAGVNAIDWSFSPNRLHHKKTFSSYPAYHTGFDTFYYVDKFIDPGFNHHRSCAHFNGLMLQNLADAEILPFNLTNYVETIFEAFDQLKTLGIYDQLKNHSIKIDRIENGLEALKLAAKDWVHRLETTPKHTELSRRTLNDQLTHLDQSFLMSEGLPLQKQYRHAVFSLSMNNFYGSSAFPGIQDLIYEIDKASDPEAAWREVEKHVSDIIIAVHKATNFLQPLHII